MFPPTYGDEFVAESMLLNGVDSGFVQSSLCKIHAVLKDAPTSTIFAVQEPIYVAGRVAPELPLQLSEIAESDSTQCFTVLLVTGVLRFPFIFDVGELIGRVFAIYVSRDRQHRGPYGWTSALLIQHVPADRLIRDENEVSNQTMSLTFAELLAGDQNIETSHQQSRWQEIATDLDAKQEAAHSIIKNYAAKKYNCSGEVLWDTPAQMLSQLHNHLRDTNVDLPLAVQNIDGLSIPKCGQQLSSLPVLMRLPEEDTKGHPFFQFLPPIWHPVVALFQKPAARFHRDGTVTRISAVTVSSPTYVSVGATPVRSAQKQALLDECHKNLQERQFAGFDTSRCADLRELITGRSCTGCNFCPLCRLAI